MNDFLVMLQNVDFNHVVDVLIPIVLSATLLLVLGVLIGFVVVTVLEVIKYLKIKW